ncbi:MAG: LamG-like jellyroll fold domain-containing protein, partial [Mycobacterium sp.]
IGTITVTADHTTVDSPAIDVLIANADGLVSADGVMLRKVDPVLPALRLITLTGNPLDNRAHDDFIPQLEGRTVDTDLLAESAAPANGKLGSDLAAAVDLIGADGGHTKVEFELPAVQTSANTTRANLAGELNAALSSALADAGFTGSTLQFVLDGDLLKLHINDASIVGFTVFDAEAIGFGHGQSLSPNVVFDEDKAPVIAPVANQTGITSAVEFSGTNYVDAGSSTTLKATTQLTLEAWIRPTGVGTGGGQGGIIINREGEYEIARFADGTIRWAFANANPGWVWVDTGYVAPLNEWTHIAVVYDNGVVSTYANGELVDQYNGSGTIGDVDGSHNNLWIGERQSTALQGFQGQIDDVRVWKSVRTQADIIGAMNEELTGTETGLAGYWTFDEAAGLALDSTGHGDNGVLAGGVKRVLGPIHLDVSDTPGDPINLFARSDTDQVTVTLDGTNLVINPAAGYHGTAHITVTALDGTGAPADYRGRQSETSFDISFGVNAIYGNKFNDLDADGVRDAGEPGLDGIEVFLDNNGNGLLDADELDTVTWTDANGDYAFRNLPVVAPVAYGPALLVGDTDVTPDGG